MVFFDNPPKIGRCPFLKVNCNAKSGPMWKHFPYFVTLNPIGLPYPLNGSFTHPWFHNMKQWSFGMHWFTALWKSSKQWHMSLHNIYNYLFNISMYLIKILQCWRAIKFTVSGINLPSCLLGTVPILAPKFLARGSPWFQAR